MAGDREIKLAPEIKIREMDLIRVVFLCLGYSAIHISKVKKKNGMDLFPELIPKKPHWRLMLVDPNDSLLPNHQRGELSFNVKVACCSSSRDGGREKDTF